MGDILSNSKLNQMTSNDQYLFENQPKVYYRSTVKRTTGTKVLATYVQVKGSKSSRNSANIFFSGFFTSGCKPLCQVSATVGYKFGDAERISVIFHGIGTGTVDHRGATVVVTSNGIKTRQVPTTSVHFLAVGY